MKRRNAGLAVLGAIVGCGGELDPGDGRTSTPRSTRYVENAFSPNPQCTMPSTWDPAIGQPSAAALQQLAPTGTLRVAVYYGNQGIGVCTPSSGKGCRPAFDPQFGVLSGTAVDLACRLQAQLKIPLVFTGYPTIAALNVGFAADNWEIGFGEASSLIAGDGIANRKRRPRASRFTRDPPVRARRGCEFNKRQVYSRYPSGPRILGHLHVVSGVPQLLQNLASASLA